MKKNNSELAELKQHFQGIKESALKDYMTFLAFESISSEPAFRSQTNACAEWVRDYLNHAGLFTEIWPTKGHPTIFAKYDQAGPSQPTLLIYNHYDVQPVDPMELWHSPPFTPRISNGEIYARGAQDNKGQCFYVMLALKVLMEKYGKLPINVKLCIEGEEECGSTGLSGILKEKQGDLKADHLAIVDLGFLKPHQPTITLGLRGIVTMSVEVIGSNEDLHSGFHGGLAFNPIHALTKLLASLRDSSGKITIPGFYDHVQNVPEKTKDQLSFCFDPLEYQTVFGASATGGEQNYAPLERNWIRPTLEVNGINGGYAGDGFKTVIPAKAYAKISCRLVPNQDPDQMGRLVAEYLEKNAPEGVTVIVNVHGGGAAVRAQANSQAVKAFSQAYLEIFDKPCSMIFSGASIPIVTELAQTSGADVVLVGLGLPDDSIHAPNEHFGIDRIENGYLSIARAIQNLSSHHDKGRVQHE